MLSLDRTDARLLLALQDEPRATVMALATTLGLSRNTVQARLASLYARAELGPLGPGIEPNLLGYPLTAFITVQVVQRSLAQVSAALAAIPEVIEVFGLSGPVDLLVRVVAVNADDLYRVAGMVLAIPDISRTETGLVMRRLVDHRLEPLVRRALGEQPRGTTGPAELIVRPTMTSSAPE